jgi:hypothetical protein
MRSNGAGKPASVAGWDPSGSRAPGRAVSERNFDTRKFCRPRGVGRDALRLITALRSGKVGGIDHQSDATTARRIVLKQLFVFRLCLSKDW